MADGGRKSLQSTASCERRENLTLKTILGAFNAPINEEQAWAVCYQAVRCSTVDVITPDFTPICSLENVVVDKDGSVKISAGNLLTPSSAERTSLESQFIKSVGVAIYSALDYGVGESEERHLSNALEELIESMIAEGDNDSQTGDEGFENDLEGSALSTAEVLECCASHLQRREDASDHYQAVCRALVAEAVELLTFLEKISTSKECLDSTNDVEDLRDLGRLDWARLWVQVLQQLRQGVKLKKVEHVDLRPLEFEMTPYEILMEDIRMRRFTLNKIMVDGEVPVSLAMKNDAHSVILDFIRSRPPLQPVSERKLRSPPPKTPILHDQLLEAIKGEHKLRKTSTRIVETSRTKLNETDDTPAPTRKVIKPDFSLLLSSFDDDSSDDDFDLGLFSPHFNRSLMDLSPSGGSDVNHFSLNNSTTSDTKHVTPDVTWRKAVARDVLMTAQRSDRLPERRHSITVCESPSKPSKKRWQNPIECLSLTVEEVMHIRSVLTKAEVESLLVNPALYSLVSRGKVCFTCKRTRFALFGPWGTKCKFCRRKVCPKCIKNMRIPTDHFENIPVYTLSPSPLSPDSAKEMYTKERTGSVPASPNAERKIKCKPPESSDSSDWEKHGGAVKVTLEGPLMNICRDCKSLVLNVIRASRTTIALAKETGNTISPVSPESGVHAPRKFHLDLKQVY